MIEALLERHIAALEANTAAILAATSNGVAAAPAAKKEAAPAEKQKPAEPAPAKAEKSAKPATEKKSAKQKDPTEADILKVFGDYLDVPASEDAEEDQAEEARRKDFVMSVLAEVGATRVREIKPEDRARAIQFIKDKIEGKDVNFGADGDEEDDDLL